MGKDLNGKELGKGISQQECRGILESAREDFRSFNRIGGIKNKYAEIP